LQHQTLDQHFFYFGAKIGFRHDSEIFWTLCLDEKRADVIA
jgi:hypothetical protein